MAVAGMGTAFSRGLRVPEDISIVGWDDITVSQYLHPALSTVTQHPFEDGRMAATLLLEAIEGREFSEPVWMPDPGFIPRESSGTGAPPTRTGRPRRGPDIELRAALDTAVACRAEILNRFK